MATAFQSNAFQNNAFQIVGTTTDTHDGWKRPGFLEDYDETRFEAYRRRKDELRADLEEAVATVTGESVAGLTDTQLIAKSEELASEKLAIDEYPSYSEIREIAASLRTYRQYLQDDEDLTIIMLLNE